MNKSFIFSISISMIIFFVSAGVSLQSNTLPDALLRSLIAFIISFTLVYVAMTMVRQFILNPPLKKEQNPIETEQQPHSIQASEGSSEPTKGKRIDLTTPTDEEEFQPFQPEVMKNDRD